MRTNVKFSLVGACVLFAATACREPTASAPPLARGDVTQEAAANPQDYVITPAGLYHRSCVHEIEEGARVGRNGLVTRKNATTYQLPTCAYAPKGVVAGHLRSASSAPLSVSPEALSPANSGWIEDAAFNATTGNRFSHLTANWVVPPKPLGTPFLSSEGQVYFAFPGLQDGSFIIQPVIQYGVSGAGGDGSHWKMASWHCDTGPGCTHSALKDISAGDVMLGTVIGTGCNGVQCTWTITTQDLTNGNSTSFSVVDAQNYYNAVGGAVEVYGLDWCDNYPINGVSFTGINLYDQNGAQVSPTWSNYVQSPLSPSCRFNVSSSTHSVSLAHNTVTVTANGSFIPTCGGLGCSPPRVSSITASSGTITVKAGTQTGTITLTGFTASGGLTASTGGYIASIVAHGTNLVTLTDNLGNVGTLTLTGAKAMGNSTDPVATVVAKTNTISLNVGQNGYPIATGYINLFQ